MSIKRILAFVLAVILLLGCAGIAYYTPEIRQRYKEYKLQQKENEIITTYNKVLVLLQNEEYEKVEKAADECLLLVTKEDHREIYADLYLKKACAEVILGDTDLAIENSQIAIDTYPELSDAYLLRAGIYSDSEDYINAKRELLKYIEYSGDTDSYMNLGVWAMQEDDFSEAAEYFTKYLENQSAADSALYYRATCYLAIEEYDKAVKDFTACIDADISRDDSLFNRAVAEFLLEDYKAAAEDFAECVLEDINSQESAQYYALSEEYAKTLENGGNVNEG